MIIHNKRKKILCCRTKQNPNIRLCGCSPFSCQRRSRQPPSRPCLHSFRTPHLSRSGDNSRSSHTSLRHTQASHICKWVKTNTSAQVLSKHQRCHQRSWGYETGLSCSAFNSSFLKLQNLGCSIPRGVELCFSPSFKEERELVKRERLSYLMQPLVTPQSLTLILAKGSTGGAVGKG